MRFKQPKPERLDRAGAEALAASALAFLTSDAARIERFLGDSGLDPQMLAASLAAGDDGVLAAALDHIASDESLLLVFASDIRRKPDDIMTAQHLLSGPSDPSS